ncbi:MAG: molybdate ABC transporter substrate-binding protein [Cyanobacteria bacterium P01_C01_bin.70]
MKRRQFLPWLTLTVIASLGAIACGQSSRSNPAAATTPSGDAINITVSAAASVQDAMKDIQAAYADVAPEVIITYNFGASGSLAQQIIQGAPSDVFLSASDPWMSDLETKGQILPGSRKDLLQNAMVLVAPKDDATLADFSDLSQEPIRKVAMGEPASVPAGQYAKDVLTALNLFDGLQPKLVFAKDVRQVLAYVETGNVDAGLVYSTDAQRSNRVQVVATAPADSHAPIIYPVAVVRDSDQAKAAQAFVDFLSSDTAIALFQGYGFGRVE